jgi:hypothetical protein
MAMSDEFLWTVIRSFLPFLTLQWPARQANRCDFQESGTKWCGQGSAEDTPVIGLANHTGSEVFPPPNPQQCSLHSAQTT